MAQLTCIKQLQLCIWIAFEINNNNDQHNLTDFIFNDNFYLGPRA